MEQEENILAPQLREKNTNKEKANLPNLYFASVFFNIIVYGLSENYK